METGSWLVECLVGMWVLLAEICKELEHGQHVCTVAGASRFVVMVIVVVWRHDLSRHEEWKLLFAARFRSISHLCVCTMLQVMLPY